MAKKSGKKAGKRSAKATRRRATTKSSQKSTKMPESHARAKAARMMGLADGAAGGGIDDRPCECVVRDTDAEGSNSSEELGMQVSLILRGGRAAFVFKSGGKIRVRQVRC